MHTNPSAPPEIERRLDPHSLAQLCEELDRQDDRPALLACLMKRAIATVTGAEAAGIVLMTRKGPQSAAHTDDAALAFETQQIELTEGPALTAADGIARVVRCDDLTADRRWPRLAAVAAGGELRAALTLRLAPHRGPCSVLTVYSSRPGAFDEDDVDYAEVLATHAAVAVGAADIAANLRVALSSRDVIGQAKGILMERFKIGPDEAFELLVAVSQRTHRKLHEAADDLATYGVFGATA